MDDAGKLAGSFGERFRRWGLEILEANVRARGMGRLVGGGWAIWYLFGRDERGEYLDFYASHRMTEDLHARLYADGTERGLPAIEGMRLASPDPEEDARLEAEHDARNRRVARMLEEKGFGSSGDEPGGVAINRWLRLGEPEEGTTS